MDWHAPLNLYCERLDQSFWAEPVNALSNAAFLLAAGLVLLHVRKQAPQDLAAIALAGLIAVIGIGSFLFHTFANYWSMMADVLPIAIFIYGYFLLAMRRFLHLGWMPAALLTLGFIAASLFVAPLMEPLIGRSAGYLPGLIAIFLVGGLVRSRQPEAVPLLFGAGLVFTVSLTFRTIDQDVCHVIPVGTHFLWHILNAVTLAILVFAAMRARAPAAARMAAARAAG
jgi:hypothetical protein